MHDVISVAPIREKLYIHFERVKHYERYLNYFYGM